MMIHDNILSGQFLLDIKNDRATSMLMHNATRPLQIPTNSQHIPRHQEVPSPPQLSSLKMDLYTAYAFQQQLQQKLIGHTDHQSTLTPTSTEVLDLSRRCDSVETTRKTPSPYHTNSSFSSHSPICSPSNKIPNTSLALQTTPPPQTGIIPPNLFFPTQAQTQSNALASLYPALYFPNTIKRERVLDETPVPALSSEISPVPAKSLTHTPIPIPSSSSLLQTLANVGSSSITSSEEKITSPCNSYNISHTSTTTNGMLKESNTSTVAGSPTSSIISSDKTTRPFKAFPRDPLVLAANFAATDVLLDNPRVERYTEYRKRVLEQIRNSNGGSRTISNPKMRRTNTRSGTVHDALNYANSENDEQRSTAAEESSDCDSNIGNFDKIITSTSSTSSLSSNECNKGSNNNQINTDNAQNGQIRDAAYFERRRKNNAAAKKSRDRRRIKEDEIAIRAAYLERQNIELLCQIDSLKAQLAVFTSKVGA